MNKSMAVVLTCAMLSVPQLALAVEPASGVAPVPELPSEPASANAPDGLQNSVIVKWAKIEEDNPEVESVIPVRLKSGENAYVAKISRFRGRNNMSGAYLVRPRMQEAREISGSVLNIEAIPVKARDSDKMVIITTGASGQGNEFYSLALVYFSGWTGESIHETAYENSDDCENFPELNAPCINSAVDWNFASDNTDVLVMKERVEVVESRNLNDCKTSEEVKVKASKTTTTTVYRIKGLRLLKGKSSKEVATVEREVICIQHGPHRKKQPKKVVD